MAPGKLVSRCVTSTGAPAPARALGGVAQRLAAEMRTSTGSRSSSCSSRVSASGSQARLLLPRRRGIDLVEVGAQRQDVEQRIEQRVTHFLQQVAGAGIAHERRARVAADNRSRAARPGCRSSGAVLGEVHALVVAAKDDQRRCFSAIAARIASLSVLVPAQREKAKLQGMPSSSSR
jgi:hypothetical protein